MLLKLILYVFLKYLPILYSELLFITFFSSSFANLAQNDGHIRNLHYKAYGMKVQILLIESTLVKIQMPEFLQKCILILIS